MLHIRGHDKDFNDWEALGNTGWNYASVLPYFKKYENNTNDEIVNYKNGTNRGTEGELKLSKYSSKDSLIAVLKAAYSEIGLKEIHDFMPGEFVGYHDSQGTLFEGERFSAARAFLLPIRDRKKLVVMKGSLVEKVLFNGTKAIGVNVVTEDSNCRNIKIYAKKEVILSAGAIHSPKVLLQSGIGRSEDLSPFGIQQVKDLAVGRNFQDHPAVLLFAKISGKSQSFFDTLKEAFDYFLKRKGTLAALGSVQIQTFINTINATASYPDVQFEVVRCPKDSADFVREAMEKQNFKKRFIEQMIKINNENEIAVFHIAVLNPTSRGKISLKSNDPWKSPKIEPNLLGMQEDLDTMIRGIAKFRELLKTSTFQKLSAEEIKFDITECNSLPQPSSDYDRCYLKYFGISGQHAASSCKMGPSSDPEAVVDSRLKVHGISNLRVVDASIMPKVVSANTAATVYMIGEKAADMIKEDWVGL
jgi:choline dehydrogenase